MLCHIVNLHHSNAYNAAYTITADQSILLTIQWLYVYFSLALFAEQIQIDFIAIFHGRHMYQSVWSCNSLSKVCSTLCYAHAIRICVVRGKYCSDGAEGVHAVFSYVIMGKSTASHPANKIMLCIVQASTSHVYRAPTVPSK